MKISTTKFTPLQGGRGAVSKGLISFSIFIFLSLPGISQGSDYQAIFGSDWDKALEFEKENRSWMEPILEKNNIPYDLALAVIFPELVRYSALRDKMEITLLKALYINLGETYANFSIGQFQMKPSFAETIRREAPSALARRSGISFRQAVEFGHISDYRKSIVTDLEDPKSEFLYLVAFCKIADKKYRTFRMNDKERVRFLATAYNYGIDKSKEEIESMSDKKFFNTKLFKTQNYSYAEVSLFWYDNYRTTKNQGHAMACTYNLDNCMQGRCMQRPYRK